MPRFRTISKVSYKVVRSIIFSVILTVAGIAAVLYVLVSIPAVQREIKVVAERELTSLIGGKVSISEISILPFNEVRLYGVTIDSPEGGRVAHIGRLGAGIELWTLISEGEVRISYAEVIALNANIEQKEKDGPLNIQFIIDAFKPKSVKPKSDITIVLHNIVLRKSRIMFRRSWMPRRTDESHIDFNHIELYDVNADVAIPLIHGDHLKIDLRRLAFIERSGFDLNSLSLKADISPQNIAFKDLKLKVASSDISISDQSININGYGDILNSLRHTHLGIGVEASPLYLSDFRQFVPQFGAIDSGLSLKIAADGTLDDLDIDEMSVSGNGGGLNFDFSGNIRDLSHPKELGLHIADFSLGVTPSFSKEICSAFGMPPTVYELAERIGTLTLEASGEASLAEMHSSLNAAIGCHGSELIISGNINWGQRLSGSDLHLHTDGINIGTILATTDVGEVAIDITGDFISEKGILSGQAEVDIPFVEVRGNLLQNFTASVAKNKNLITGKIDILDPNVSINGDAEIYMVGNASSWVASMSVDEFRPGQFSLGRFAPSDNFQGNIAIAVVGDEINNFTGSLQVSDFIYVGNGKNIPLRNLAIESTITSEERHYSLESDYLSADIKGIFSPTEIVPFVRNMLHAALPSFCPTPHLKPSDNRQSLEYAMTIKPDDNIFELLKAPLHPIAPIEIAGRLDNEEGIATLSVDAPYLIKGKDKIIKGSTLDVTLGLDIPASVMLSTEMPVKHGVADIMLDVSAYSDNADASVLWKMQENPEESHGEINLKAELSRSPLTNSIEATLSMLQSEFLLAGADWKISPASISYSDKLLTVSGLNISHGLQFVNVSGRASADPLDIISVKLNGVDLQYIFDILNINYVDFGGIATGEALAGNIFSGTPEARTNGLFVKNLSYNGAVLGDANLESHWDHIHRMVAINADIAAADTASAKVRGGVYVTRDSLSFDFDTKKIDIEMLQPFMSGFTSSVKGKASGNLKLFGTFSDIDLTGAVMADTITMKVDYTNVCYSGRDSVFFDHGRIRIPNMRLYDRYGHSAQLTGLVRHNYLHDAKFDFEIKDAHNLLVYDTDAKNNGMWYGRVFANGDARLIGVPGVVKLDVNMSTAPGSKFTIELDETQTASEYDFLTFSDHKKELQIEQLDSLTFEDRLRRPALTEDRVRPSLFSLDMALDVTPATDLVIVMDPAAGDKIRANGSGALQMHYDSDEDELKTYGKYTLDRGTYNFSLQELILKNFIIKNGSSISFNGDPMNGLLDITAAYRVNTNLADLDVSFRDDPDLTRTTIPVDALLRVTGDIHTPEIKFDIDLPTVTSEVERKMRSLISTEDMMNRQVIYLLALNRFYSPEYAGGERGGELASVASSTLSSQIQNFVGSLTDKLSVAPSIKSEKSDLSDMEFDLALSSSLFDNRLLLNGNLGYRDKSTSQTTFIGDFDLEYLLSRNGQLRLKAYNHFNDASYYLKSALTTQGIGLIYRREFDHPFTFIKRLFNKKRKTGKDADSNKNREATSEPKTRKENEDI